MRLKHHIMRLRPLWRSRALRLLILSCVLFCLVAAIALFVAVRYVPFDAAGLRTFQNSTIVLDRSGRPLRAYLANDDRWRVPIKVSEVSPWMLKATVAVEDKRFYSHAGVDPIAIARAMLSNLLGGRIVSGASTLTMQAVGFEQGRERTLSRKLAQAFRALQLERTCTKPEILEIYYTHAPFGGNICGVEAAARRYFNKSASDLTLSEAALLAGVPQRPENLRPDRNLKQALKRRDHVLARMLETGAIKQPDYAHALSHKPRIGAFDSVREAPHFSDFVAARHRGEPRITTTLDSSIQKRAEELLRAQVGELAPQAVTNGALVVIENPTGYVRAMVGSVDYNSVTAQGQVNGATSARSPGSALKPLIYALAYETGSVLPGETLYDVPRHYLQYEPENFDRQFHGLVRADKALAWSLNVPAIQVLNETGLTRGLRFMRECGLSTLERPSNDYGLSLAIGTCGVTLLELTNAYAILARGGVYKPWNVVPQKGVRAHRLLGESTCYFVTRALADAELRAPEGVDPHLAGLSNVAWKTGTSNGFRDAWTIAYDAHYTVGVWLGNMNGRPSRALVGAKAAAPVALGMIQRLRGNSLAASGEWPRKPPRTRHLIVCSDTGKVAAVDCPSTRTATAPVVASVTTHFARFDKLCDVHRKALVDAASGYQLCGRCAAGRQCTHRTFAFWPPAVSQWLTENHPSLPQPPAHNAACATVARNSGIRITSPKPGDTYYLLSSLSADAQKLALEAATSAAAKKLFWFMDGELVQTTTPGATCYLQPKPGRHRLRLVDDTGTADYVSFTVQTEK